MANDMTATMYFTDRDMLSGIVDLTIIGKTPEELRASFEAAMVDLYGQAYTPTP